MASIDISKEKLLEMTNYQNDTIGPIRNGMWYIGVSKDGKKQLLVSTQTRSVKGKREKNRVIDWLIEMYVF